MGKVTIPYDHFAIPIQLNIRGQEKRKSWCGFIATLLFIALILWFFGVTVDQMAKKENPVIAISEKALPDPPSTSLDDFIMVFDFGSDTFKEDVHFTYAAWITAYGESSDIDLEMHVCDDDDLGELKKNISLLASDMDYIYCIPKGQKEAYLLGTLATESVRTLYVQFSNCEYGVNGCDTKANVEAAMEKEGTLGIYYGVPYFDGTDYDQPIKKYLQAKYFDIDCKKPKQLETYIAVMEVKTDDGFIGKSESVEKDLLVNNMELGDFTATGDCILNIQIQMSNRQIEYTRVYPKIQDVLAKVTGIASVLVLIFAIVLTPFFKLDKDQEIVNRIFYSDPNSTPFNIKFHHLILAYLVCHKEHKAKLAELSKKREEVTDCLDVASIARAVHFVNKQTVKAEKEEAKPLVEKLDDQASGSKKEVKP